MMGAALVPSACRAAGASLLICYYIMISSQLVVMAAKSTYLTDKRNVCFKCPPGTKVQEDCKEDPSATEPTDPVCVPCDNLTYADKENGEKYCKECWPGNCLANQEEAQQCTKTTNRACRCLKGYFAFHLDKIDQQVECRPHTVCKPGEGEVYPGNATHDRRCEDPDHHNCQGNTTDANSTTTSESTGHLDGAAIFGLVYAGQVFLTMAVGAFVICCEKKNQNPDAVNSIEKMCSRPSIFFCGLAFLPGVGIFFATILLVTTTGKNRPQRNAELDEITVVQQELLPPHDTTGQAQPNGDRTCSSTSSRPNDQQNGAAVGATATSWSKKFIQTKVFNRLSEDLGFELEPFMHELPGFSGVNIEQKKLENPHHVPNLIRACLQAWQRKCPDHVTQYNICSALESVGRREVIETLKQEHARYYHVPLH